MARWKKPGKGTSAKKPSGIAPILGCGLFIFLVLLFMSWALSGVLNPR